VLDLLARARLDPLDEAERRARAARDDAGVARIAQVRSDLRAAGEEVGLCEFELSKRPGAETSRRLRDAQETLRRATRERGRIVRNLVPEGAPAEPAALQRMLGERERILSYLVDSAGSVLIVVPPSGAVRGYALRDARGRDHTETSLAEGIEAHLQAMAGAEGTVRGVAAPPRAGEGEAGAVSGRLFRALVPPEVWEEIRDLDRVYLVPNGPLHRLPFETLDVGGGATWLEKGPPIAYEPSGSVLLWCRRRRDEQRGTRPSLPLLALGDCRFDGFPPLPGTRREVEAIGGIFEGKAKLLLGADATEKNVFDLAPTARLLHLATHQLVDETEGGSFSRFALTPPPNPSGDDDGFLHLHELVGRWRDRLFGCELVALSACETTRGPLQRDEGSHAMPIGFLYAGAPAVIASLWRVDDASTAELFADFYGKLRGSGGRDKLAAFTEARKALKKKYPEPYFWAPFVYIGDPR